MRPLVALLAVTFPLAAAPVPKVVNAQLLVVMPYPAVPKPDPKAVPKVLPPPVFDESGDTFPTGKMRLVLVNDDGSDPRPLTEAKSNADCPAWSPDGKRIAFISDRDKGRRQVFVADADGTNVKQLTTDDRRPSSPSWTPDGKRLVYARQGEKISEAVAIDAADGGNEKVIWDGEGSCWTPAVSPDGKGIAFWSNRDGGGTRLYVMDADGTNITRLTDGDSAGDWAHPAWSADGKRIAFSEPVRSSRSEELHAVDADGKHRTQLTEFGGMCQYPAFSSDGKRLAFVRFDPRVESGNPTTELVIADAGGKNPKAILKDVDVMAAGRPAWRPK